ncbi:hypothetical protein FSPOR_8737 [Fusarium sporotrichioides]|uniref:Uncharacterized protein n=1 Tax=Fusarium sporotrichioides TaxID=5514 RepID=A0A395RT22_FUSSP|nr:hypothetical protein FSPOR_8737 [Fusarium sporotrichioides]
MRRDYEENPPEGTRDLRMDLPSNNPEKHFEYYFDEDLDDIVPDREAPSPLEEPEMIQVYFGFDEHQPEDAVHLEVLEELFPDNVKDFVSREEIRFPQVPDEVKSILIGFLYTGGLNRPDVNSDSPHEKVCKEFEIMFHLNAAGCYTAISRLTTDSHAFLWEINLHMTEEETKDIVNNRIHEKWPNRVPEWYKAFLDDCVDNRVREIAEELRKPIHADPNM